jgi:hypothetical protein
MRELKRAIWPYKVIVNSDIKREVAPMEQWLDSELGHAHWNVVYHYEESHYYFRSGEDAVMFKLKWS